MKNFYSNWMNSNQQIELGERNKRKLQPYLNMVWLLFAFFLALGQQTANAQATILTNTDGGVTVTLSAMPGVLPEGTRLSVQLLNNAENLSYANSLENFNGVVLNQSFAFNITLWDNNNQEVQPNGEVTVSFSGIEFDDNDGSIVVFHAENSGKANSGGFNFAKK